MWAENPRLRVTFLFLELVLLFFDLSCCRSERQCPVMFWPFTCDPFHNDCPALNPQEGLKTYILQFQGAFLCDFFCDFLPLSIFSFWKLQLVKCFKLGQPLWFSYLFYFLSMSFRSATWDIFIMTFPIIFKGACWSSLRVVCKERRAGRGYCAYPGEQSWWLGAEQ